MKTTIHALLPVTLACLAANLSAQDEKSVSLYLSTKQGEVVSGRFLGLEGDRVKLAKNVLGGTMTVSHKLDDLEPMSAFRVRLAANPPVDYASHFAMARLAADSGLLSAAGREARAAIASAQGGADFESQRLAVRKWAADALEKMVSDAVAANDLTQARDCLKILTTRLADQRSEEQLDVLTASVEKLTQASRDRQAAERQARIDAKTKASNERKLEAIVKLIAKGEKEYGQAIRKSGSTTASKNLCENAIGHFKKAFLDLQALVEKSPGDAELAEAAEPLAAQIHDQGIAAALHAANMLMVRSDYKNAMEWAQRVIAFDPENQEARDMAAAIAAASAASGEDWGWAWPIVSRPRPVPSQR